MFVANLPFLYNLKKIILLLLVFYIKIAKKKRFFTFIIKKKATDKYNIRRNDIMLKIIKKLDLI